MVISTSHLYCRLNSWHGHNNNNNNYDNLYGAVTWPYRYKGASQTVERNSNCQKYSVSKLCPPFKDKRFIKNYRIFAYIRRVLYKVLHTPHPGCDLYSMASNLINFLHERAVTCVVLTIPYLDKGGRMS